MRRVISVLLIFGFIVCFNATPEGATDCKEFPGANAVVIKDDQVAVIYRAPNGSYRVIGTHDAKGLCGVFHFGSEL